MLRRTASVARRTVHSTAEPGERAMRALGSSARAIAMAAVAAGLLAACTAAPRYPVDRRAPAGDGGVYVNRVHPHYPVDAPSPAPPPRGRGAAPTSTYLDPRAAADDHDAPRASPNGSVDSRAIGTSSRTERRRPAPASPPVRAPATLSPSPYAEGASRPEVLTRPHSVVVREGESVFDIAERFRTPVRALIEANGLQPPYALTAGMTLKLPPPLVYTVQSGDTLFGVARRFNIDPRSLAYLNDIAMETTLSPGHPIALPTLARDQGPNAQARGVSPVGSTLGRDGDEAGLRGEMPVRPPGSTASRTAPPRGRQPAKTAEDAQEAVGEAAARSGETARGLGAATDAQVGAAGRGRFVVPLRGEVIATFGVKGPGQRNDGVNIAAPQGSPVKAAAAGEVVYAGSAIPGFGNLVLIKHAGGWVTAYAHLDSIAVKMRSAVAQGETLGAVGQTGGVDRPQLHFEIRYPPAPDASAKPVDPALLLPGLR